MSSRKHAPAVTLAREIVDHWFDDRETVKLRGRIGEREWVYRMVLSAVRKGLSLKPGKVDPNDVATITAASHEDAVAAVIMDTVGRVERLEQALRTMLDGTPDAADDALKVLDGKIERAQ